MAPPVLFKSCHGPWLKYACHYKIAKKCWIRDRQKTLIYILTSICLFEFLEGGHHGSTDNTIVAPFKFNTILDTCFCILCIHFSTIIIILYFASKHLILFNLSNMVKDNCRHMLILLIWLVKIPLCSSFTIAKWLSSTLNRTDWYRFLDKIESRTLI